LNEKHTFEVTWSKYVDLLAFQGIAFICVCVSLQTSEDGCCFGDRCAVLDG